MIYNNVEYLSLPQQVEKNKDDIAQLKTDTAKRVYISGDTLPTPAVGAVHTYIVVQTVVSDEGMLGLALGATNMFAASTTNIGGTIITIGNYGGVIHAANSNGYSGTPANLVINSTYVSLLRLY
jgi:hypothetical protein